MGELTNNQLKLASFIKSDFFEYGYMNVVLYDDREVEFFMEKDKVIIIGFEDQNIIYYYVEQLESFLEDITPQIKMYLDDNVDFLYTEGFDDVFKDICWWEDIDLDNNPTDAIDYLKFYKLIVDEEDGYSIYYLDKENNKYSKDYYSFNVDGFALSKFDFTFENLLNEINNEVSLGYKFSIYRGHADTKECILAEYLSAKYPWDNIVLSVNLNFDINADNFYLSYYTKGLSKQIQEQTKKLSYIIMSNQEIETLVTEDLYKTFENKLKRHVRLFNIVYYEEDNKRIFTFNSKFTTYLDSNDLNELIYVLVTTVAEEHQGYEPENIRILVN